jgi:hypothetical protein
MKTRILDEAAVAAGTVMLTAYELAPRLGMKVGRRGAEKVRARAKIGALPCYRPNARTFLFHWPSVVEAVTRTGGRRQR